MICGNIKVQITCQRFYYTCTPCPILCEYDSRVIVFCVCVRLTAVILVSRIWQTCYHFSEGRKAFLKVDR